MSSPPQTLSQAPSTSLAKPLHELHQDISHNYGEVVAALAEQAGKPLMPWQKHLACVWSSFKADKTWCHSRIGGSIPRQAGKSFVVRMHVTCLAMVLGYRVLWTEHNYSTTLVMLDEFRDLLGTKPGDETRGVPYFNKRLKRVNAKTSSEAFYFKPFSPGSPEGCIKFSTRTKTANLGSSFDIIVIDEAQQVTQEHLTAILPTTSSGPRRNPQYLYLGTPRRAGSVADRFEKIRNDALAVLAGQEEHPDLAWIEYGLPEIGDVTDESRWPLANPSLCEGGIANIISIRAMMPDLGTVGFGQECLGVWLTAQELASGLGAPVIDKDSWEACATAAGAPANGQRAYAIKFAADGSTFAACVAVSDGQRTHVELVDHRATAGSKLALAKFIEERCDQWPFVVDGKAGSQSLIDRLRPDIDQDMVTQPGTAGLISACQSFVDAIDERSLTWFLPKGSTEQDELSRCVLAARKRKVGQGGGWGFDGEGSDVAEACALAAHKALQLAAEEEEDQEVFFG